MSEYTISRQTRHGLSIFTFDANEHNPAAKRPNVWVVLRPTAESYGLTMWYFNKLLSRAPEIREATRKLSLKPQDLLRGQPDLAKDLRGSRPRDYLCLHLRKVEVLLAKVDTARMKNKEAAASLRKLHGEIDRVIEAYYHDGGALNPERTAEQNERLLEQVEAWKARYLKAKALADRRRELLGSYREAVAHRDELIEEQEARLTKVASATKHLMERLTVRSATVKKLKEALAEHRDEYGEMQAQASSVIEALRSRLKAQKRSKELTDEQLAFALEKVNVLRARYKAIKVRAEESEADLLNAKTRCMSFLEEVRIAMEAIVRVGVRIPPQAETLLRALFPFATKDDFQPVDPGRAANTFEAD